MALPQIDHLKPNDILKLLQFSSALIGNFEDFINTTLKALMDVFDYPISTYTVYDEDEEGNRYIAQNFSNYFSKRDLEYYANEAYKSDSAFQNSKIDWANNSSKYAFVSEFKAGTASAYERTMVRKGIRYQVRVGSHLSAAPPIHVLSIYKPLGGEPLDEYELLLLSAIGRVFSEIVGRYKSYISSRDCLSLCAQYLDTETKGIAIYSPQRNSLKYNRMFYRYGVQLGEGKPLNTFASDLISAHRQSAAAVVGGLDSVTTTEGRDCVITVREAPQESQDSYGTYYFITISPKTDAAKPQKPAMRKQYVNCHLTTREIEIVRLVEEGRNNKEISEKLVISMPTVKTHIKNIFSKFGVSSRAELLDKLQD